MRIKVKTQENESLQIQPYGDVVNFYFQTDDMIDDRGELFESKVSIPMAEVGKLINYLTLITGIVSPLKIKS